jgi:chromosome segregation ATPase
MSDLTENLEKLIQKAALDGALTEGAVDQFHALVTERDALKDDNDTLNVRNKDQTKTIERLSEQYNENHSQLADWAKREQDLKDREGKCTELEIRKECAEKRVEDHQSMVGLIFRNAVMKKGVMTPLPGLKADQYGTSHAPYAQKDDVEEEET